ncbi:hypothetical protein X975_01416, partial [Stegodyphus mimosarum]
MDGLTYFRALRIFSLVILHPGCFVIFPKTFFFLSFYTTVLPLTGSTVSITS